MTEKSQIPVLTKEDFTSDQEVRWCPGCGDYAILAQVKKVLPEIGVPKENIVFVSGIGCSSRFPYYMETYGLHGIHGRAPALASGIKLANPDLSVFVITGDGDALSIGGNHFIHLCRRNIDMTVLLFNNRIYGLTKGQYSPTSEQGKITKSSPFGSLDYPFNPVRMALASGAGFVARSIDRHTKHLAEMIRQAALFKGTAFIEIYQNCNIFNDGAYEPLTNSKTKKQHVVEMEEDRPYRFGPENEKVLQWRNAGFEVADWDDKMEDKIIRHSSTAGNAAHEFSLAAIHEKEGFPTPIGVFRRKNYPTYDELLTKQIEEVKDSLGNGDLNTLLHSGQTWEVK